MAHIGALIIDATAITTTTPAQTAPPTLLPTTYPSPPALSPNFAPNIAPTLYPTLALTSLPTLNYYFFTPCNDISLLEPNADCAYTEILNDMTGDFIDFSGKCAVGAR